MKTKGALIREFNQPWAIEEIEIGDPQPGEVKVQIAAAANLSRTQILQQAGTAMVAQANQLPQSVLQLLKG